MGTRPMGIGLDHLEGLRRDGTSFPVEIGLSAIETPAGKLAVAFVSDITERRRLEWAERTHTREIQALAARLLTAQEEERRRVSRELHDHLCQQLASLAMDMGGLASGAALNTQAQSRLKSLQVRAIKASEETRHIAYELHPSVLDDLGVVASLRSLAKEFSNQDGIAVDFASQALPNSLPLEIASCLYRVAQESLQNIARHSGAKHSSITIAVENGAVILKVADDGSGFDLQAVRGRGGLGLVGMEERTRLVNGKLPVDSRPGRGTRIALSIPLPASL